MSKGITVLFDNEFNEYRLGMPRVFIRLGDITAISPVDEASASRIVLRNGRSYIVDDYPDSVIEEIAHQRTQNAANGQAFEPILEELHSFPLIKEERQPKSWLGRMFADAVHCIKGGQPVPPIRVTHDGKGRKLTREDLAKIYDREGNKREAYIASQPDLVP